VHDHYCSEKYVCFWHQAADFRAAAFPSAIWGIAAVVAARPDTCIIRVRTTSTECLLFYEFTP